ncbi:MAG: YfjI family protein, partial [Pseudomonadota bacterium]
MGEEWPEPSPLTIHDQADPYPLDALPSTIGAAVQEAVSFVQCPVALAACSALSVVSTVAQGLVDVRRAEKLEGPSSLYLLAVADSGERKTTVDGFFSKPVAKWEAEQAEAAKPAIIEWEALNVAWEAEKSGRLAAIKEASKNGKSTCDLKRKLTDLEKDKPERPKVPRLSREDTTPEATALKLAKEWPIAGILSSEAGTVFGSHGMGKDSVMRNLGMLNKLWEAGPLSIDRKTTGSFIVRCVRLTMGLAVQPETVRTFLENSKGLARGIGFLARFLIAWPESTQGRRMYQEPPSHWPHLGKFHRRLGALLDHPLSFNNLGELEPKTLELSPDAKAIWVAFHNEVEAELLPG